MDEIALFSFFELKKFIYVTGTILGVVSTVVSFVMFNQAHHVPEPTTLLLPAAVLMLTGCVFILFGLVTYLISDDPEVWS